MRSEWETGKKIKLPCNVRQRYSLRSLVRRFVLQMRIFQALLQRPDALKIELDGNDLGAGALILALALKCCQARKTNG